MNECIPYFGYTCILLHHAAGLSMGSVRINRTRFGNFSMWPLQDRTRPDYAQVFVMGAVVYWDTEILHWEFED